jgi:hypothetical protein
MKREFLAHRAEQVVNSLPEISVPAGRRFTGRRCRCAQSAGMIDNE